MPWNLDHKWFHRDGWINPNDKRLFSTNVPNLIKSAKGSNIEQIDWIEIGAWELIIFSIAVVVVAAAIL